MLSLSKLPSILLPRSTPLLLYPFTTQKPSQPSPAQSRRQALQKLRRQQQSSRLVNKYQTTSGTHNSLFSFVKYHWRSVFALMIAIGFGYGVNEVRKGMEVWKNPLTGRKYVVVREEGVGGSRAVDVIMKGFEQSQVKKQIPNWQVTVVKDKDHIILVIPPNRLIISQKSLDTLTQTQLYSFLNTIQSYFHLRLHTRNLSLGSVFQTNSIRSNKRLSFKQQLFIRNLYGNVKLTQKEITECVEFMNQQGITVQPSALMSLLQSISQKSKHDTSTFSIKHIIDI